MNQWLWAATVLVGLMAPLGGVAVFAGRIDAFVAAQAAGVNLTLVLMMLTLMLGSLMISLGIIGSYVFRVYQEVLQRPRYLIAEKVNLPQ